MFSKNKKKGSFCRSILLSILGVSFVFNFAMNHFFIQAKGKKVNCEAFFAMENGLSTTGVLSLHLDGINKGRMGLSATIKDKESKIYNLLRSVNFHYKYEGDGYISLNKTFINKNAGDNIHNEFLNETIFDFSVKDRKMRITELGNGFLLWNDFSPVMLCIPKDK